MLEKERLAVEAVRHRIHYKILPAILNRPSFLTLGNSAEIQFAHEVLNLELKLDIDGSAVAKLMIIENSSQLVR